MVSKRLFPLPIFLLLTLFVTACGGSRIAHSQALASATPLPSRTLTVTAAQQAASATQTAAQPAAKTPTSTPSAVPALRWTDLRSAAYPNEHAAGGAARLSEGVLEQRRPGGGTVYFQLSHLRTFADLDGDGSEDALVFLLVDTGGPGTLFYLYPALNRAGQPQPGEGYFLGEGVFLRSLDVQDREITLLMDAVGSRDYTCCPKDSQQLTFQLKDDALALQEMFDLPDRQVGGRPEAPPERLELAAGADALQIEGEIGFNAIDSYRLQAGTGQELFVAIQSPREDVLLSVFGEDGGQALVTVLDERTTWRGALPTSQDYLVQVVALGGETKYTLTLALASADTPHAEDGVDAPEPGWAPEAEARKVVYLTFDDGPSAKWTPRILEALARYDAQATFFVLGEEVEKNPLTTAALLAAGHSIGNHSATHQTFEGITRFGFRREVGWAEALLDGYKVTCLRPPYGAVDAYTRLYAAEMGYRTVLWDVDPQDWRRPGVTAIAQQVLSEAQPGDVILLHDAGGDRSQTVLALEIILRELSEEGYVFEVVCR